MIKSTIKGIGFYVPDNVVTNDDLAKLMTPMMSGSPKEQGLKKDDIEKTEMILRKLLHT
jgi:3-oxoacyl-[acyl-carrier-protein] synthase III